jgi:hypothetical protein
MEELGEIAQKETRKTSGWCGARCGIRPGIQEHPVVAKNWKE